MRHKPRFRRRSAIFRLERLEDGTVLSTFPVLNLADSGADSLRQAILDANATPGADVITFAPGLHGTITLTSGELQITNDLDIEGPGANKLTISGSNKSRIFDIGPDATDVTIAGLTIADGLADGNAPIIHSVGGGILNQGDLTLNNVVVSHNLAVGATKDKIRINQMDLTGVGVGGGVANLGTLTVSDSTFTGNQARGANGNKEGNFPGLACGGGLANGGVATATVTDSQFTSNLAQGGNGSISTVASRCRRWRRHRKLWLRHWRFPRFRQPDRQRQHLFVQPGHRRQRQPIPCLPRHRDRRRHCHPQSDDFRGCHAGCQRQHFRPQPGHRRQPQRGYQGWS